MATPTSRYNCGKCHNSDMGNNLGNGKRTSAGSSNTSSRSSLSSEAKRLLLKLTAEPLPVDKQATTPASLDASHVLEPRPTDTPATSKLILSAVAKSNNPIREVYFPHDRTSGPATQPCVTRPGVPRLSIITDTEQLTTMARDRKVLSTHDQPPYWPPPSGVMSWQMCRWVKGSRELNGACRAWSDDAEAEKYLELVSSANAHAQTRMRVAFDDERFDIKGNAGKEQEERDEFGLKPLVFGREESVSEPDVYGRVSGSADDYEQYGPPHAVLTDAKSLGRARLAASRV